MDDATRGQCRCGRLKVSASARPLVTMACHCTGCQAMTASAFSLSTLFRAQDFEIELGETRIGGLHGGHRHHFCVHCLTWAFTRPEGMDGFVNVRAPMLAGAADAPPFIETYTSERLPWVRIPARHSFERFPDPSDFPALLAEYAAQNA